MMFCFKLVRYRLLYVVCRECDSEGESDRVENPWANRTGYNMAAKVPDPLTLIPR